jgi:uncharacterized protein (TIGR02118 family)
MASLVILYGHPSDPAVFEDYYTHRHIPYAAAHMPGVRDAENLRVAATADGSRPPYYRISQLRYDSLEELQAGITSEQGKAVLADLDNFATGGTTVLISDE